MMRRSLVWLLIACGNAAFAADIEIGPGDDFRSAMQNLGAGDTLIMHGGTYTLSSYFELDLVGTAGQPITIRAAAGEQPVMHYVDDGQNIVNIADSGFLTIDGIEINGGRYGNRVRNNVVNKVEN